VRGIDGALVTGDTDRSASGSGHRVSLEAEFFDDAQDSLDLTVGGVAFHYD
jgi:hypothetical protein